MKNFNLSLWKIRETIEKKPSQQLREFIRLCIHQNGLKYGDRLPSQKNFKEINNLNLTTVKRVYAYLIGQGLIYTKPGSGTFVGLAAKKLREQYQGRSFTKHLPIQLPLPVVDEQRKSRQELDFMSIGLDILDPAFTPFHHLNKYQRAHQDLYSRITQARQVQDLSGLEFRASIQNYFKRTRGFWLEPGYLHIEFTRPVALKNLLQVLLPGEAVVINTCPQDEELLFALEERAVIQHALNMAAPDFLPRLEMMLENIRVDVLYIRPQCSYPEGHCLDEASCVRLIELAKQHGFYILEEDPYHEFWYAPERFRPLANYDHDGHVVYLGVLSQLSVYMLNTYVICASMPFIERLNALPRIPYPQRNLIEERAIAELLDSGELWSLVKVVRNTKKKEKTELQSDLTKILGAYINIMPSSSGLTLWVIFPEHANLLQLMQKLEGNDIIVPYLEVPAKSKPVCHKIRLGFGTFHRNEATKAAYTLLKLLESPGKSKPLPGLFLN